MTPEQYTRPGARYPELATRDELEAEIDRLRAELAAMRRDAEWRPLSTAPHDEVILLAIKGGNVTTGDFWPGVGFSWDETDGEPEDAHPTHWRPLPPPPAQEPTP